MKILKLFIVHHTHTDIGYTDIQTKIFEEHAKFKWTCEMSWMVKNYFKKRPERIFEFIKRIEEGKNVVTLVKKTYQN